MAINSSGHSQLGIVRLYKVKQEKLRVKSKQ